MESNFGSTKERTLIIIKHDGVARGLMGEIIARFERVGLKMVGLEFIAATDDMSSKHYPDSKEWKGKVGARTLAEYKEKGIDAKEQLCLKKLETWSKDGWWSTFRWGLCWRWYLRVLKR